MTYLLCKICGAPFNPRSRKKLSDGKFMHPDTCKKHSLWGRKCAKCQIPYKLRGRKNNRDLCGRCSKIKMINERNMLKFNSEIKQTLTIVNATITDLLNHPSIQTGEIKQ